MTEQKKSFVMYADLRYTVQKLSDEEAGELFKHLLDYVNDVEGSEPSLLVQVASEPIKRQIDRDQDKWKESKLKKSESASIGNLKRWHYDLYVKYSKNELTLVEALSIADDRKLSHRDKPDRVGSQEVAKVAVTVNDTVNDTVTVNVNDTIKKDIISISDKAEKFKEFWNDFFLNCNNPQIKIMNSARKNLLRSRLKDFEHDGVVMALKKVKASKFLNAGWCNVDWVLKSANMIKILEGNYDEVSADKKRATSTTENVERMRELERL